VAVNAFGESPLSNCVNVKVQLPIIPEPPILNPIRPNPSTSGTYTINWSVSTNAEKYYLYRYSSWITTLNSSVQLMGIISQTQYIEGSMPEGRYYYVVCGVNINGSSAPSNCESILVQYPPPPPKVYITAPNNLTVYTSSFGLTLTFVTENMPNAVNFWFWTNSSTSWTKINGNTTFNAAYVGSHQIKVIAQTVEGVNVTSDVVIFLIRINGDNNAGLQITATTTVAKFQQGMNVEITITILNNGTSPFPYYSLYFYPQTSEYYFKSNYYFSFGVIYPGQQMIIKIYVMLITTNPTMFTLIGDFSSDILAFHFEMPIQPKGSSTTLYIYIGVGGTAVVGLTMMGGKAFKSASKKKEMKLKKNEPQPSNNSKGNPNSDFEIKF
jgi:hypothetical protein